MEEEWEFSREKHGSKKLPKDVPPVDSYPREKMVNYHKARYKHLHSEIEDSEGRVHRAQAGFVRDRPVTAPDLLFYEGVATSNMAVSTLESQHQTVLQRFSTLIKRSATSGGFHSGVVYNCFFPKFTWFLAFLFLLVLKMGIPTSLGQRLLSTRDLKQLRWLLIQTELLHPMTLKL